VAERDLVLGKPHGERADESAGCVLDEMRQPIVGHGFPPVPQHGLGVRTVAGFGGGHSLWTEEEKFAKILS
jgi:hypothetical protein